MYIKSYSCTRFAGLSDKNIEFDRGLNIILGANESGKSTIINGIHSTLFKNIRLKKNVSVDSSFVYKYMPKPEGDFIDGNLVISVLGEEYKLSKEWGVNEKIHLITPDGEMLKNEERILEELSEVLLYGEGTYSHIVFAKQGDIKAALGNIIHNNEVTNEITNLLRRTMMELDGISIDYLQKQIEDEIEILYKRWDIERNSPEKNRGINNPYKVGLGKILKSYYDKEELVLLMEQANKAEENFEKICNEINILETKLRDLKLIKEKLEKIEEDVNSRMVLEAELNSIQKELDDLTYINREWPKTSILLEQDKEKIRAIEIKKDDLVKEKENFVKVEKKLNLQKRLDAINEINIKIDDISKSLETIPYITKEDINELSNIETELLTLDTTMKAGVMIGELKKSTDDSVWVVKDLGEKSILEVNEEFKANGLISIICGDRFELEVRTGEFDFKEIKNKHDIYKSQKQQKLEHLKISTIEEGKLKLEKINNLINDKNTLSKQIDTILEGCNIEDLKEEIKLLEDINISRQSIDIDIELKSISNEEVNVSASKITKENQMKLWIEKYIDDDNLLNILIDKKGDLNSKNKMLEGLASLPEEFNSSEEFKTTLKNIKIEFEEGKETLDKLKIEYYDFRDELLDVSYEELKKSYTEAEKIFNRNIIRGEKLLEIQRVFKNTKENLDKNPMETLVNEFSRTLSLITDDRYKTGDINEDFNISLENAKGEIPIDLLSAGTYDAVTLALRFSLLKHIFKDRNGYVILDDCLVDLDPIRKEKSVKLIQDFAEDNQVIFTTCDPETARLLGGSIINLG